MKVIYANTIFYALILFGLVGAAVNRHLSANWQDMNDVKNNYDIIGVIFCIWLVSTIYGLFKRKAWAYSHALSLNAVMAIVPVLLLTVATYMLWKEIDFLEVLISYLDHFLVSAVAFIFWLMLLKSSSVKKAYNKSLNQIGANNAPPG